MRITRGVTEHYSTGKYESIRLTARFEYDSGDDAEFGEELPTDAEITAFLDDMLATDRQRVKEVVDNADSMIHFHPAFTEEDPLVNA